MKKKKPGKFVLFSVLLSLLAFVISLLGVGFPLCFFFAPKQYVDYPVQNLFDDYPSFHDELEKQNKKEEVTRVSFNPITLNNELYVVSKASYLLEGLDDCKEKTHKGHSEEKIVHKLVCSFAETEFKVNALKETALSLSFKLTFTKRSDTINANLTEWVNYDNYYLFDTNYSLLKMEILSPLKEKEKNEILIEYVKDGIKEYISANYAKKGEKR